MNHNNISFDIDGYTWFSGVCGGFSLPDFLGVNVDFAESIDEYLDPKGSDDEDECDHDGDGNILYEEPNEENIRDCFNEYFNQWYKLEDFNCVEGMNNGSPIPEVDNYCYDDIRRGYESVFRISNSRIEVSTSVEYRKVEHTTGDAIIIPNNMYDVEPGGGFYDDVRCTDIVLTDNKLYFLHDFIEKEFKKHDCDDKHVYFQTDEGLFEWLLCY